MCFISSSLLPMATHSGNDTMLVAAQESARLGIITLPPRTDLILLGSHPLARLLHADMLMAGISLTPRCRAGV